MNVAPYGFPENCDFPAMQSFCSSSYYPLEVAGLADTPPQDRALAALKNHKEAEKRRRERINSHLDKLRSLLPCNSKVINFLIFRIILSLNYYYYHYFFSLIIWVTEICFALQKILVFAVFGALLTVCLLRKVKNEGEILQSS